MIIPMKGTGLLIMGLGYLQFQYPGLSTFRILMSFSMFHSILQLVGAQALDLYSIL